MAPATPLRSFSVSGFKSLADVTLDLTTDVTVLVGANGSGKSSLVDAFELVGRVVDGELNKYVARQGGMRELLHRPKEAALTTDDVRLTAWGEWHDQKSNGYEATISSATEDTAVVEETTYFHERSFSRPHNTLLGTHRESVLRSEATTNLRYGYVLDVVSGCRVFHFDDTSPDAPVKRLADSADNLTLAPDAENLAPLLLRLKHDDVSSYGRIVRTVRSVAPFFNDFVLEPERERVRLRWSERSLDGVFSAESLSDGTLRFICLATLLLQPDGPRTVVLDEPELGLHPFAIHQLAALMRAAATGKRVVAATQSVTLLSHFGVEEVAVLERTTQGTQIHRPVVDELAAWLGEFTVGEMWEKNLLGGRPAPDDLARNAG